MESVYYSVEELDALNRFETHKMVYALECNAVFKKEDDSSVIWFTVLKLLLKFQKEIAANQL